MQIWTIKLPTIIFILLCISPTYGTMLSKSKSKGGEDMAEVGQTYRKKKPSGMSRQAKDRHNAYQRQWNKDHPKEKREINRRYWEKKAR